MGEPMAEDLFRELDTQLAALRSAAKSLREERPSWADNTFHPGRRARQEAEFDAAVVTALKEIGAAFQKALAQQESKFAEVERQTSELERQISELKAGLRDAADHTAELRDQVGQAANDHATTGEQIAAVQKELANEFRERIQHLLDEQRVAIRQLALKASEDAILADRVRRATELKLEELAKRLPPAPPA
jgi:chromosome segregation ATPase